MKFAGIASLLTLALAVPLEQSRLGLGDDLRHVELAPGVTAALPFDALLELKRMGQNFMDTTGHNSPQHTSQYPKSQFPKELSEHKLFEQLSPNLSKVELELKLAEFSSFYTRYARSEYGLNSSLWLYGKAKELAGDRKDITVRLFDHEWEQKSVILRINGTKNPDKVVVVGAHQDSINLILPSVLPAPGADDDGSGTVTTLEVLRVLLESGFKPENTVEFHWYSAEELGLLGSQDVFERYSEESVDVRAMLQQDMTGYSAGSKEKNDGRDELGVIGDFVDEDLTEFIKLLITEYCTIPYVVTECGYACSDHSSASKYGYQSAFVIEADFKNTDKKIHTTEDKLEYLDFDHMLEHAKLTLGYAIELGNASDL